MEYLKNKKTGQVLVANPILKERKDMVPFESDDDVNAHGESNEDREHDLMRYKKDELEEIALGLGLEVPEKIHKADLIEMIIQAQGE